MFSDYSPAEWCDPCKNHGNYPRRPQKSYLHSILSLPFPLQVKNVSHYFPSLIFWSQCMVIFFSEDVLVTNYFGGDLPSPSKYLSNGLIPQSFWTSLYKHEKSSFVFCPTFSRKVKSRFRALALGPVSCFWNKSSRQVGTSLDCTLFIGLANT